MANVAAWILCAIVSLAFLMAGWIKLAGTPNMVEEFHRVGLGQWFRYFTGVLEVAGAIGVLIPRVSRAAASLLAVVMLGAIVAHLTVLHSPPTAPVVLLLFCAAILWLRGR